MHADGDWQAVEVVLTKHMATVSEYLQTWKLKLSTTKTVSAAFHLNNKEAKRELKVKYNNKTLPFCSEPKYLGWADNPTRLRIFIPDTGTHSPGMSLPNRLRTGVGRCRSCLYKWGMEWPPQRPESVAQKNKPSTLLSSNVQSIDLPMDCMA